jgi:SNF2 family DNA or RNA helicase
MNHLYLLYSISIEPFDSIAIKIKDRIDFNDILKKEEIKCNEEVKDYFRQINMFCPLIINPQIHTYYIDFYERDHQVKILFYKVFNSEYLTPNYIENEPNKNILTSIHRTININNNLLGEYDKYFNKKKDKLIKKLCKPRFYNLSEIPINSILKIKLFDYQIDNINWMLGLEDNLVHDYITSDKLYHFPDGRIFNYSSNRFIRDEERELVKLKGGLILDDVGIGKTVQLLSLCLIKPDITTIILVPDHLKNHWKSQFTKHFIIDMPETIKIVGFSEYEVIDRRNYKRLIVDEIHELYSNPSYTSIFNGVLKTNYEYKWGISATPFPIQNSITNILRFLTEKDLFYGNMERFNNYFPTYQKIMRKNTLKNIVNELVLPRITEHNLLMNLREEERIIYDAEVYAGKNSDEDYMRKCCCDISINYKNQENILNLMEFNQLVLQDYKNKYEEQQSILDNINLALENCYKRVEEEIYDIILKKELTENINHFEMKKKEQEIIVKNREKSYRYLHKQIYDTEKNCPFCLSNIEDDSNYDVLECGHIYCTECIIYWMQENSNCGICRQIINKEKKYTITKLSDIKLNHSTKITKLIEIIKSTDEKIIIYTQFDDLIEKLNLILCKEEISNIIFKKEENIIEFSSDKQVLILSSAKNSSGIDLSFVSNIVIFEPIKGNHLFLRDIEKQIIGRIYRINQTRDINVFRFIIKNSIEEEIFNQNFI